MWNYGDNQSQDDYFVVEIMRCASRRCDNMGLAATRTVCRREGGKNLVSTLWALRRQTVAS